MFFDAIFEKQYYVDFYHYQLKLVRVLLALKPTIIRPNDDQSDD